MTIERAHASDAVRADVMAGLSVAVMGIPQALAYAMMAGLPPAYGLVAAGIPAIVAALAGRTPWVSTGPTNATSLLVLGALAAYVGPNGVVRPDMLHVVATLTLLAGAIRIAAALGGAVVVLRFLPESVLTGFMAGAGILIGVMQLDEALGLPSIRGTGLAAELRGLASVLSSGAKPEGPAVATCVAVIAVLLLGRRLAPRWPWALLAVLLKMLADYGRALRRLGPEPSDARFLLHGGIAVIAGILVSGIFELNLGDSEVLALFLAAAGLGYAAASATARKSDLYAATESITETDA